MAKSPAPSAPTPSAPAASSSARLRSAALALFCLGVGASTGLGCEEAKNESTSAAKTGSAALGAAVASALPVATVRKTEPEKSAVPAVNVADIECKDGPNVDFHDPGLEAEVRRKLEQPDGPVKKSDLAKVKSVNLARNPEVKVDYLDPCVFPHLTQVKDLFLGPGALADISALAKLSKLTSLRISMSQVSDVSALKDLKKLDRLDLGHTQIVDLSPLAGLTSLTELQLDNTKVKDVTPLAGLKNLVRLSIQRTEVKDIAPLKPLENLKYLYIAGAMVEDPYAVARPGLQVSQQ